MDKKELEAFAREAAKTIKTEKDLSDFSQMLTNITVETVLGVELDDHLGYDKHQPLSADNSRNGYSSMTLITEDGSFEVDIPRDRAGNFEPKLVKMSMSNIINHPKFLELAQALRRQAARIDELQAAYEAAGGKGNMPLDQPFRRTTDGIRPLSTAEYNEWHKNLEMIRKLGSLLNGKEESND